MSLSYLCSKLKSITEEPEDLERIEYEVKNAIKKKVKSEKVEKVKKELLKQIPNPYRRSPDPWTVRHFSALEKESAYDEAIRDVAKLIVEESL